MRNLWPLLVAGLLAGCVTIIPPVLALPTVEPPSFLPADAGVTYSDSVALCRGFAKSLSAFSGDVERSHLSHGKQAFAWTLASALAGTVGVGTGGFYSTDTGKYGQAAAITTLVIGIITAVIAVPAGVAGNNATSQSDQLKAARSAVIRLNDLVSKSVTKLSADVVGKPDDDKTALASVASTQLWGDCFSAATVEGVPEVPEALKSPEKLKGLLKEGKLDLKTILEEMSSVRRE